MLDNNARMDWPDGLYVTYSYDTAGALTHIAENGASSGIGVLATYAYDNLGRVTSLTRGNGVVTGFDYDASSRLSELTSPLQPLPLALWALIAYVPSPSPAAVWWA